MKYAIPLVVLLILLASCKNSKIENHPLRVMSYNVHNCIDMNNEVNYEQVAHVINQVDPQVVALQELDSCTDRSKGVDVLAELAAKTRMHGTYGAAIDYRGGKYGIGVLSKELPIQHRSVSLPGREEQRLLLLVEFKDYVLACTHFSLTEEDRNLSLPIIFEAIKDIKKPLILAGDMNDVPQSRMQQTILTQFTTLSDPSQPTIPSKMATKCIDYIYARKDAFNYEVSRQEVIDEKIASDHLPLFVDVLIRKK